MKYVKLRLLLIRRFHKGILYSHWRIKGFKFSLPLSLLPSKLSTSLSRECPFVWRRRLFKWFKMSSTFCILMALLKGTQYSWICSFECLMLDPGRIHKNLKIFEATGHKEWLDTSWALSFGFMDCQGDEGPGSSPSVLCSLNFGTWLGYDYRIGR